MSKIHQDPPPVERRLPLRSVAYKVLAAMAYSTMLSTALLGVQIAGVVTGPDGAAFSGSITVQRLVVARPGGRGVLQDVFTAEVSGGKVSVQLPPNSALDPLDAYAVRFQGCNADFTERWVVPASSSPLTLENVRVGSGDTVARSFGEASIGASAARSTTLTTEEAADFASRPTEGPLFGSGAVVLINQQGQIETVAGDAGSCVTVDGTTAPCVTSSSFSDSETPTGAIDGTNQVFQLANTPDGLSLNLFMNGLLLKAGVDYTLTGSTIQFISPVTPSPGDSLTASYRIAAATGNSRAMRTGARAYSKPTLRRSCRAPTEGSGPVPVR